MNDSLSFTQSAWLKPYIDLNTRLRAAATNKFAQNFHKAMINSVFGKLMENVRNRRKLDIVQNKEKLKRLASQPSFKSMRVFREDLVAVERYKTTVKLDKPIYSGFCVLDLSKVFSHIYLSVLHGNQHVRNSLDVKCNIILEYSDFY